MSIANDLRNLASEVYALEARFERVKFCALTLDSSIRRAVTARSMEELSTTADSGHITAADAMTQLMEAVGEP